MDESIIESVFAALCKRSKGSYLTSTNLAAAVSKRTGISVADVKAALGRLSRDGRISGGVTSKGDVFGKIQITEPITKPLTHTEMLWQEVIKESDLNEAAAELMKCSPVVEGLSREDMRALLQRLKKLKDDSPLLASEDPYCVSASYLLGSSKALDKIGRPLGLSSSQFQGRAAYIVVAGPPEPECVLLIENQAAFETFCAGEAVNRAMAVATFGYGLAWSGVAGAIGTKNIVPLVRLGHPPAFSEIIGRVTSFFWGDLDKEGINIYLQLRRKIPTLKLSALYRPMIAEIHKVENSHPYCVLAEKTGQKKPTSEDAQINSLLQLCRHRAVDQEIIRSKDIERLFNVPLDIH